MHNNVAFLTILEYLVDIRALRVLLLEVFILVLGRAAIAVRLDIVLSVLILNR